MSDIGKDVSTGGGDFIGRDRRDESSNNNMYVGGFQETIFRIANEVVELRVRQERMHEKIDYLTSKWTRLEEARLRNERHMVWLWAGILTVAVIQAMFTLMKLLPSL